MIARPDADLAIIAHLFWGSEPSYYCKYPERLPGSNVELILRNLRKSRGCLVIRLAPKWGDRAVFQAAPAVPIGPVSVAGSD
jgi:hypothetical protein